MGDLEDIAGSSLAQVRALGNRITELEAHLGSVRSGVQTAVHQMEGDFAAISSPHDGLVARLESSRNRLTQEVAQTLAEGAAWELEIHDTSQRLSGEHHGARERLAQVRTRVHTLTAELERFETETKAALHSSQQRTLALMTQFAKALDTVEHVLSQTMLPTLKAQQDQVRASQNELHTRVALPMVEHLHAQNQDFARRLQALADTVGQLAAKLDAQVQKAAADDMQELDKQTAVNFRGGNGAVVESARQRANSLTALSHQHQQDLEAIRVRLGQLSEGFKQAVGQADGHYKAVAGVTVHLEQVLSNAG